MTEEVKGTLIVVNGPVVEAKGMGHGNVADEVEVGPGRLVGEIIEVAGDVATIQVYEDTTGLRPGMGVVSLRRPLSVELGPGLVGNTFDGIQRPMDRLAQKAGDFVLPGVRVPPLDREKTWHFRPSVAAGQQVGPLTIIGEIPETLSIAHRVMIPPNLSGELAEIAQEGDYRLTDRIALLRTREGEQEIRLFHNWPARLRRPTLRRLKCEAPLVTGQRILDYVFPIPKGGVAAIAGGFGTGKTVVQQQLAKWSSADIIVYIGCGERGNEMTQILEEFPKLVDPRTGHHLTERTVLIANTSNMPVTAREASIYTGITIAEYFRDMGYEVGVMADSTSRWAEALREISGRLERMPAEEGYPAYLASSLAAFYERAGRAEVCDGRSGSVTIVGAVSPQGSDFSEPVTQHTQRFVGAFWALSDELAAQRHFPAIDWNQSYSNYLAQLFQSAHAGEEMSQWEKSRRDAMEMLQEETKLQKVAKLVGPDALPDAQRLVLEIGRVVREGFLQQSALDPIDSFCSPEKQQMMIDLILDFYQSARSRLKEGVPALTLMELPIVDRLVRMKNTIANDTPEMFEEVRKDMESQLGDLAAKYRAARL